MTHSGAPWTGANCRWGMGLFKTLGKTACASPGFEVLCCHFFALRKHRELLSCRSSGVRRIHILCKQGSQPPMTQQTLAGVREVSKDAAQLAVSGRSPPSTDAHPSSVPQPYTLCGLLHTTLLGHFDVPLRPLRG